MFADVKEKDRKAWSRPSHSIDRLTLIHTADLALKQFENLWALELHK